MVGVLENDSGFVLELVEVEVRYVHLHYLSGSGLGTSLSKFAVHRST